MTDVLYDTLLDTYAEYGIEIRCNLQDYNIYIGKECGIKNDIVNLLRANRLTVQTVEMDAVYKLIVR